MTAVEPRNREGDQPPPLADGQGDSVQDELLRLVAERRELGRRRYGTDLRTFNGRDALRDALDETLDLAAYLVQARMEMDDLSFKDGLPGLRDILSQAGVEYHRHQLPRLAIITERLGRWREAAVVSRTNRLARQTADARQAEAEMGTRVRDLEQRLADAQTRLINVQDAAEQRTDMLLVAWEKCTPAWLQSQNESGNPQACALTARAWAPGRPGHYHPRAISHRLLERENAIERKVHHADQAAGSYDDEQ